MCTKNGPKAQFQCKSKDLSPLRVNKLGTNLVLFQISFIFVGLNKNLSF